MAAEFRTKPQDRNSDHVKSFYPIFTTSIGVHGLSGCEYHQQMHKLEKTSLRPLPAPPRNGIDSKTSRILAMADILLITYEQCPCRMRALRSTLSQARSYSPMDCSPRQLLMGRCLRSPIVNGRHMVWSDVSADHQDAYSVISN